MKRRNFIKSSLAAGAALAAADFLDRLPAQTNASGESGFATSITPSGRPLFFLPDRLAALKSRIATHAPSRTNWSAFLQRADDVLAARRSGSEDNGLTARSRLLGLAWRITGDERYAKKLRDLLLQEVAATDWMGQDVPGRTPRWHSWLGTGGSVVACATGREALAGFLSPTERQQITEGMVRLGLLPILRDWVLPEERIHALDSMGHNWWSVCVSGAGVGALALLGENPQAADWLARIETALTGFFDYRGMVLLNKTANFDPAGAFYESVHYAGYALESYLTFRLARTNAVVQPPQSIPVLERMAEFFVHTSYPASGGDLAVNFGDSSLNDDNTPTLWLLAALGFSPELTRWYLQRPQRAMTDPLALLYEAAGAIPPRNALPVSVIYPTIGWAMLRNSWDDNATLLGLKSGFTWNHAHADAGSFVLFHGGQPLIMDSGFCAYGRPEYLSYYCQSRAHNVVLFNGQGQPAEDFHDRGVKFPGHVHDLLDAAGLKYIYADATGPMARHFTRNYRHWLWLDGTILIFDDILAHEAGEFDWLLHYAGEAQVNGATVHLTNDSAAADFTLLHPADAIVGEETGLAAGAPDKTVKYLKFSTGNQSREQKFIAAIVHRTGATAVGPKIELVTATGALGVIISGPEQVTEVYLNLMSDGRRMHMDSNNVINGWETDAYLLAWTRPASAAAASLDNCTRFFAVGCSYLRRDGQSVLDSFAKVTAVFQPGDHLQISLTGQPHSEVAALALRPPASLQVNGQPADFEFDPARRTVRFKI